MRAAKIPLLLTISSALVVLVAAACGGGDSEILSGGDEVAVLTPGEQTLDMQATLAITLNEEQVSAAPALGAPQTVDLSGSARINVGPGGGTFDIPEFGISGTIVIGGGEKGISVSQGPQEPSTGRVELPEGGEEPAGGTFMVDSFFDVYTEIQIEDRTLHNDATMPLEGTLQGVDGLIESGSVSTPPDFSGVDLLDLNGASQGSISAAIFSFGSSATPPPEGEGQPTTEPGVTLPGNLEPLVTFFGVGTENFGAVFTGTDPTGDWIYGDPTVTAGFTPAYTDIGNYFAVRVTRSPEVAAGFDTFLPCDAPFDESEVVCAQPGPLPEESFLFGEFLQGVIPAQPDRFCTYAVVTNNGTPWIFNDPFSFDFYQGAGRWTQLIFGPDQGWGLFADEVDPQQVPQQSTSNARAYIFRDPTVDVSAIVLDIPVIELEGATGWRITADCNEAFDPAQSGGDVPGPDPTGGLLDLPTAAIPIFADGFESGDTSAWSTTVP